MNEQAEKIYKEVQRQTKNADCFQPSKDDEKSTLTLELWRDGSGKAFFNYVLLADYLKMSQKVDKKNLIAMLREAANLIESGVV